MNNHKFMRNINVISRCSTAYRDVRLNKFGITGNQAPYVSLICTHPGLTQEQIACKMHVNRSTITRIIDALEKNGFAKRERSESDKRIIQVFPTEKAIELLPTVRGTFRDWKAQLTEGLTNHQLEMLEELTEILAKKAVEIE